MKPYTRREAKQLEKPILGEYHDLILRADQAGYEDLLDAYNVPAEQRRELIEQFKQSAADQMKRHWNAPK
jgi:acetyl-CoA carboxylase carboxyltransferase component